MAEQTLVPEPVTRYALGLAFSTDGREVLLLLKNRPDFLAGLWNGIGGHIEAGESARAAMAREFTEEAGLAWSEAAWQLLGERGGEGFHLTLFTARGDISGARTMTDEPVAAFALARLADLPLAPALGQALGMAVEHWAKAAKRPAP